MAHAEDQFRRCGGSIRLISNGVLGVLWLWATGAMALQPLASDANDAAQQVPVLVLRGTPYEQGFTHGRALGGQIVRLFESCVLDARVLRDAAQYETGVRGRLLPGMTIDPRYVEELTGMLAGIRTAVGEEGLMLGRLQRPLDLQDLMAVNAMADWYGAQCSSFSAWGERAEGGGMITARNLDYLDLPGLRESHVVLVYADPGEAGRRRWVSIAWPGIIGAYTAMNEEGVTVSMHDAPGRRPTGRAPFTPRAFALREIMETASAADYVDVATRVLRSRHAFRGNNIHVSGPFRGQETAAVVFEYDGDLTGDEGATLRLPDKDASGIASQTLLCTNHYRQRGAPTACGRFDTMAGRLGTPTRIDLEAARLIMKQVSVGGTLHSVIFFPNDGRMWVGVSTKERNAAETQPREFRLNQLFQQN